MTWVRKDLVNPTRVDEEDEAMASLDRDIGELQEAVSHLRETVRNLMASTAELKQEISKLQLIIAEGRGGWKALTIVGGFAAAVGAIVTKLMPFFLSLPR